MSRDAQSAFARALVDEWVRAGVTDAVAAPGARCAPLTLALAGEPRLRLHVVIDERSAAFLALGLAKASGLPAAVVCTSGTAAANLHPAVLEASHARTPLLVCTADRPPELRDVGAGQTVDQHGLYGTAVRWFFDPGPPDDLPGAGPRWRALAARAVAEALGPPPGPVHLNLPFREPLVPTGDRLDVPGRPDGRPWTTTRHGRARADDATLGRLTETIAAAERGVVAVGWGAGATSPTITALATAAGWPVLADACSGLRCGPLALSAHEALVRAPGPDRRPELAVRLGAPPTARAVAEWLAPVPTIVVDPDATWADPSRTAVERVVAEPDGFLDDLAWRLGAPRRSAWLERWVDDDRRARRVIDDLLDGWGEPFEGRVARDVASCLPDGSTLVVASSMPVRDLDAFAAPRRGLRVLANRGVSGIDGTVSTTVGVALASRGAPTVALLGDLAFLHDINGLLGAARRGIDATLVVVDNDGGGIFSFLPQAGLPECETLFAAPHGVDLVALAAAHGVPAVSVDQASDVPAALLAALRADGVRVVVVPTSRATSVARHQAVWSAVAHALAVTRA